MFKMESKNEMRLILILLKNIDKDYNANNISKVLGITPMGALKIFKKLEKEKILISKKIGNTSLYKINFNNKYAFDYAEFLLKKEAELSPSYIKRWVYEIRKVNEADMAIIFGSVLKVQEKAGDVDVLFVVKKNNFNVLKKKIEKLNRINEKKIHPIYQTLNDLKKNLIKKDKVIMNILNGVIIFGGKKFVSLIKDIK